jgi:hypothetical protein
LNRAWLVLIWGVLSFQTIHFEVHHISGVYEWN